MWPKIRSIQRPAPHTPIPQATHGNAYGFGSLTVMWIALRVLKLNLIIYSSFFLFSGLQSS